MKKLFLNLLLLISLSAFSQSEPFIIQHCKDKMTDREYYLSESKIICANPEKTKGFTITPNFRATNGKMSNSGFICKSVNVGKCVEKDNLIFLFEDDTKITLTSWNDFNCDGNSYFNFTNSELRDFSSKKVIIIRFMNGRTYDTFTYKLQDDQKDYFIRAYTNQKIVEINCSN
jgi:hypothetical protein